MNESFEIAEKWSKALRSGEYEQACEVLKHDDGGYCCLGVLCDVSKFGNWNDENNYILFDEDSDGLIELDVELMTSAVSDILRKIGVSEGDLINMNDEEIHKKACIKFEKGETYNNPKNIHSREYLKDRYAEWVVERTKKYSNKKNSILEILLDE